VHGLITRTLDLSLSDSTVITTPFRERLSPHTRSSSKGSGWLRFDSEVSATRRVVDLKNGLNGSKIAAFALYASRTTIDGLS